MPEIVTCPSCDQELRVPDGLFGKTVRCPQCKGTFTARPRGGAADGAAANGDGGDRRIAASPSASAAPPPSAPRFDRPEEDDEDHPRPREEYGGPDDPRQRRGWSRTRTGLTLFIIGVYVFLGTCALGVLGLVVALVMIALGTAFAAGAAASNGPNSGTAGAGGGAVVVAAAVVAVASYLLILVGSLVEWVLQSVGQVFMLWVPSRAGTGRRPLAIVTVALWFAQLALTLFSWGTILLRIITDMTGNYDASIAIGLGNNCLSLVHFACGVGWFFVFMFLLRSIARGCGEEGLARGLLIFTIIALVFGVVSVLAFFGLVCGGGAALIGFGAAGVTPQTVAGLGFGWLAAIVVFLLLFLVLYFALWIWWVVLLHQTRGAVTARLSADAEPPARSEEDAAASI
jgi:predicted Zn finger-like uncharacterized protein